ncbi:triose-phosphate transporter family protein [Nitzschia inconspicua]|uniref:Triose-phosphate transporter family protein n=1 Tax=Nitzschia inconspicua TaxID=303405 RepID=A0A9K3LHI9_9STRA|nr:triose-phosphate transporter family protein [Nitzschia inconspicua]
MLTTLAISQLQDAPKSIIPSLSALSSNVQLIGTAWLVSSALFTTYSTTTFLKFESTSSIPGRRKMFPVDRSTLLTLYRFSGSLLLGLVAHTNLNILARIEETLELCPTFFVPAIFLFIANYSNSISLDRIGISLTYTSKCAIPLITLLLTVATDGVQALPNIKALLTLIPIALGIATSSWNHPTFEPLGFLAAMTSCTAQSALNVSCKKAMNKVGASGPAAQRAMVAVGLVIALAYSTIKAITYPSSSSSSLNDDDGKNMDPPASLSMAAVLAYHMEYVLSFSFVKLVQPITYSACDAVRRLAIIISGHYMFGGPPFTLLNILGIALALSGALAYSILNH